MFESAYNETVMSSFSTIRIIPTKKVILPIIGAARRTMGARARLQLSTLRYLTKKRIRL